MESPLRASMWHSAATSNTDWALSSWKQCTCIGLIQWTNAMKMDCLSSPRMSAQTNVYTVLQVLPAQSSPARPRATAVSSVGLLHLPETRGANLGWSSSPYSKIATKTTLASLKLALAYRHSTEITYRIAYYRKLYSNTQGYSLPWQTVFSCLPKFKYPSEREDTERHSARYQTPRQFGLKGDREATVLEKELSLE